MIEERIAPPGAGKLMLPPACDTDALRTVLDGMSDAFYMLDADTRFTYLNDQAEIMLGRPRSALLGLRALEAFPELSGTHVQEYFKEARTTGKPVEFVNYYAPFRRWFEYKLYPSPAGLGVLLRDASERITAERALRDKEARLRLMLSEVPGLVWHVDTEMRLQWIDGSAAPKFNLSQNDVGRSIAEIVIAAPDGKQTIAAHKAALAGRATAFMLQRHHLILEGHVEPMLSPEGDIIGAVGAAIDVTGKRGADLALRESKRQLAMAQEVAQLGSWQRDLASGRIDWSDELYHIVGSARAAEVPPSFESFVYEEDAETFNAALLRCVYSGERIVLDHRIRRAGGELRWVRTTAEVRASDDRNPAALIGAVLDITAQKAVEEKLAYLAHFDSLTGFRNRQGLAEELERMLGEASRAENPLYIVLLDLDGFKSLNGTLGHEFGNGVLEAVAKTLRSFKEVELFARIDADEFVLVSTAFRDDAEVGAFAERITERFKTPLRFDDREHFVGGSIGISCFPRDGDDAGTLISSADTAMYKVKENGGRNHCLFATEMRAESLKRIKIEHDLHLAIERNQFILHYQPLVDVKTGKIVAAEALIRWQHPEIGLVRPDLFIPIAESTGQIVAIGAWVLHEAAQRCADWQQQAERGIRVCVNISTKQLTHPSFLAEVERTLQETKLAPDLLELEITETATLRDMNRAIDVLSVLRSMGIRCSIDDFGTGYSSLSYLKKLPADVLKIDRSFVSELETNESDRTLVESMVYIAHKLGLSVVGEGVETIEQYRVLADIQCDEIQGYYLSKPVPEHDFVRLLRSRREYSLHTVWTAL